MTKKLYEWVKASERLPEVLRMHNLRFHDIDGYQRPLSGQYAPAGYFSTPLGRYNVHEIEWLDESGEAGQQEWPTEEVDKYIEDNGTVDSGGFNLSIVYELTRAFEWLKQRLK